MTHRARYHTESVGEPSASGKVGSRHMPKLRRISSYILIDYTASCEPVIDLAPSSPCSFSLHDNVYDDYNGPNNDCFGKSRSWVGV